MRLAVALNWVSLSFWLIALTLTPFGDEPPGIYVLFLVCTIGMIYPTVAQYGILNYWYLVLVYRNFAGRSTRAEGLAYLGLFTLALLWLLFDQYVMLGAYNMGELRLGSLAWMLALVLAGLVPVIRDRRPRKRSEGSIRQGNLPAQPPPAGTISD